MADVLSQLILLGVAAAFSTVPVTAAILLLLSDRRVAAAFPFLAGTVIGTFSALTIATLLSAGLPGRPREQHDLIDRLKLWIGIALVLLGVFALVRQSRVGRAPRRPAWLDEIASFGPLPALGIGLALNLRPKALLLVGAASLAIAGGGLTDASALVAIIVYTVVASSSVVAPVVAFALFPGRMESRLVATRDWLTGHAAVIGAGFVILVGGLIIGAALGG
jgi:hypothetical protein